MRNKQSFNGIRICASILITLLVLMVGVVLLASGQKGIMKDKDIIIANMASASDFTMSGTKITGYTGTDTHLTPDEFPSTATTIGFQAFSGTAAQIIELPATITTIEASGFWNSSITSITIPSSVTYIGSGAFYRCYDLETVFCEFTNVSVFEYAQFSYVPDSMVIYAPYDSVSSFQSSLRLAIYRNRVQTYAATLSYVTNNGSTMQDAQIHYGQSYANFITPLTKEGYTFTGWKDSSNNDITSTSTYLKWNSTETLTAQFEKEEYEVKIEYNNQTYWLNNQSGISTSQAFVEYGQTLNLSTAASALAIELNNPAIVVSGFEDINGQSINWTSMLDLGIDGTQYTFVPIITNKVYTLNYNTGLGNGWQYLQYSYEDEIHLPTITSSDRIGYTYQGWVLNGTNTPFVDEFVGAWNGCTNSNCSKYVSVKWVANTYEATLVYGDGSTPDEVFQVTYDSHCNFPVPTRNGYSFVGWQLGNKIYTANSYWNIPNNATLNAYWILDHYSITINSDGGTYAGTIPSTCTYYDVIPLPTPTKYGYNFVKWQDQNNNEITTIQNTTHPLTITAQWRKAEVVITSMGNYVISKDGNDDIIYLDLTSLNVTLNCTYTIDSDVNQVYIKAKNSLYTMQKIIVSQRTNPLLIVLDTVRFSNFGTVIDATNCSNLTIHSIGTNNAIQSATLSGYEESAARDEATIKCNSLTITGSDLEIIGGSAFGSLNNNGNIMSAGAPAIKINGNLSVNNQSLVVYGGSGAFVMPGSGFAKGGKGGVGIYFIGSSRTMSVSQDTYVEIHGGDGGAASQFRTSEEAGDGNYAIRNVAISGLDSQDRFYGGNGGPVSGDYVNPSSVQGSGSVAAYSVTHNLNSTDAAIVFIAGANIASII